MIIIFIYSQSSLDSYENVNIPILMIIKEVVHSIIYYSSLTIVAILAIDPSTTDTTVRAIATSIVTKAAIGSVTILEYLIIGFDLIIVSLAIQYSTVGFNRTI